MSSAAASVPPPPPADTLPGAAGGGADGPRWPPRSAWLALITAFGGALLGALVIGAIGVAFGGSLDDPPASVNILSTVFQDLSLVGAALIFARLVATPRPADFGLRATPIRRALGLIVLAFVAFYAFTALWVALLGATPEDERLPEQLGVGDGTGALLAIAVLVAVVAPICEEFFFRGYFYGALRNWRGVVPAAVICGIVFGAIHAGSAQVEFLVPLAAFGAILCLLRERTGSLYPGIVLHSANNSIAFGVSQDWGVEIAALFAFSLAVFAASAALVRRRWA